VAANVCGLKVGPVAVLGQAVDRGGGTATVCVANNEPVTIEQTERSGAAGETPAAPAARQSPPAGLGEVRRQPETQPSPLRFRSDLSDGVPNAVAVGEPVDLGGGAEQLVCFLPRQTALEERLPEGSE
jgi:hypothetical protein